MQSFSCRHEQSLDANFARLLGRPVPRQLLSTDESRQLFEQAIIDVAADANRLRLDRWGLPQTSVAVFTDDADIDVLLSRFEQACDNGDERLLNDMFRSGDFNTLLLERELEVRRRFVDTLLGGPDHVFELLVHGGYLFGDTEHDAVLGGPGKLAVLLATLNDREAFNRFKLMITRIRFSFIELLLMPLGLAAGTLSGDALIGDVEQFEPFDPPHGIYRPFRAVLNEPIEEHANIDADLGAGGDEQPTTHNESELKAPPPTLPSLAKGPPPIKRAASARSLLPRAKRVRRPTERLKMSKEAAAADDDDTDGEDLAAPDDDEDESFRDDSETSHTLKTAVNGNKKTKSFVALGDEVDEPLIEVDDDDAASTTDDEDSFVVPDDKVEEDGEASDDDGDANEDDDDEFRPIKRKSEKKRASAKKRPAVPETKVARMKRSMASRRADASARRLDIELMRAPLSLLPYVEDLSTDNITYFYNFEHAKSKPVADDGSMFDQFVAWRAMPAREWLSSAFFKYVCTRVAHVVDSIGQSLVVRAHLWMMARLALVGRCEVVTCVHADDAGDNRNAARDAKPRVTAKCALCRAARCSPPWTKIVCKFDDASCRAQCVEHGLAPTQYAGSHCGARFVHVVAALQLMRMAHLEIVRDDKYNAAVRSRYDVVVAALEACAEAVRGKPPRVRDRQWAGPWKGEAPHWFYVPTVSPRRSSQIDASV